MRPAHKAVGFPVAAVHGGPKMAPSQVLHVRYAMQTEGRGGGTCASPGRFVVNVRRDPPVLPVSGSDIPCAARLPVQCGLSPTIIVTVVPIIVIITVVFTAAIATTILRRVDSGDDLKIVVRIFAFDALEVRDKASEDSVDGPMHSQGRKTRIHISKCIHD